MSVAKIIEIVGSSEKGWEDTAQKAIDEAKKTIRGIHGLEILHMTASVDKETGKIKKFKSSVKIAFSIED
jgi:flavin-binding protein dodecin